MGTSSPAVIETVPASKTVPRAKRQRRSLELKRQIVEETLVPGASVARVARTRGVNANQVFQWRRLYRAGKLGVPVPRLASVSRLLPVHVSEIAADNVVPPAAERAAAMPSGREASEAAAGAIHVELRKARLRIKGNVDPAVLRLVLKALLG